MPLSQYDRDLYAQADPPYRTEVLPTCAYCGDRLPDDPGEDYDGLGAFCSAECADLQEAEDRALDPRSTASGYPEAVVPTSAPFPTCPRCGEAPCPCYPEQP